MIQNKIQKADLEKIHSDPRNVLKLLKSQRSLKFNAEGLAKYSKVVAVSQKVGSMEAAIGLSSTFLVELFAEHSEEFSIIELVSEEDSNHTLKTMWTVIHLENTAKKATMINNINQILQPSEMSAFRIAKRTAKPTPWSANHGNQSKVEEDKTPTRGALGARGSMRGYQQDRGSTRGTFRPSRYTKYSNQASRGHNRGNDYESSDRSRGSHRGGTRGGGRSRGTRGQTRGGRSRGPRHRGYQRGQYP
jgi:hypothetical protein